MAKINARGTHQVGPTLFAEKSRTFDDETRVYYEAWRLRSDGVAQRKIIRSRPAEGQEGFTTEHRGAAFVNVGRAKYGPQALDVEFLRKFLVARSYTIVKER